MTLEAMKIETGLPSSVHFCAVNDLELLVKSVEEYKVALMRANFSAFVLRESFSATRYCKPLFRALFLHNNRSGETVFLSILCIIYIG